MCINRSYEAGVKWLGTLPDLLLKGRGSNLRAYILRLFIRNVNSVHFTGRRYSVL